MEIITAYKEDARRRQSWTRRMDAHGLPGKIGYFEGSEWADLEAGARAAGYTYMKKIKGLQVEVPDVTTYVMHLHRTRNGASSG